MLYPQQLSQLTLLDLRSYEQQLILHSFLRICPELNRWSPADAQNMKNIMRITYGRVGNTIRAWTSPITLAATCRKKQIIVKGKTSKKTKCAFEILSGC